MKEGKQLELCNSDGILSVANTGEDARRSLGITRRMSLTWEESTKAFRSDDPLRNVLGEELVDKYMAVDEVSYRCQGFVD